ncbi:MAG TPA: hypothetical protein VL172_05595 [Kofleriaceae bacterium]|nr:hypothetical protein [Kofleriaceae bacterium]
MPPPADYRALALRWGPLGACALVLVVHSLAYNFVTDDAYISFVYARNLAEHGQLTFNLGDAVEGYTNFLWTVLLAVSMKLGISPEVGSRLFGTGFALGTLYVVKRIGEVLGKGPSLWDHLAPALLALSAGYACWSSGGLETQMFTFWVALALLDYARADAEPRRARRWGVWLALAALTRPEGLLVAAVLALHRLAINVARDRRWRPTNDEIMGGFWFVAIVGAYMIWRWRYYGELLPNTYSVKAAGATEGKNYDHEIHSVGWHYLWTWVWQTRLLVVAPLAVAGLVVARPHSARFTLGTAALAVTAAYLAYTVDVGGDFMGLHRFVMPLFVIAAVGVAAGLRLAVERAPAAWRTWAGPGAAAVLVGLFAWSQISLTRTSLRWRNWTNDRGIDTPSFLRVFTADRAAIGKHMRGCFGDDDFAVFGGVGAQPYYAEVDGIDLFGLVSWDVAHCAPRSRPRPGHNKWAPADLLARQPRRDGHFCPDKVNGRYDWSTVDGGPPTFWFACYSIHADPHKPGPFDGVCPPSPAADYERVTLHIPELQQKGQYYTFYKRKDHPLPPTCEGVVPPLLP